MPSNLKPSWQKTGPGLLTFADISSVARLTFTVSSVPSWCNSGILREGEPSLI